jgi:hypothetical protein
LVKKRRLVLALSYAAEEDEEPLASSLYVVGKDEAEYLIG